MLPLLKAVNDPQWPNEAYAHRRPIQGADPIAARPSSSPVLPHARLDHTVPNLEGPASHSCARSPAPAPRIDPSMNANRDLSLPPRRTSLTPRTRTSRIRPAPQVPSRGELPAMPEFESPGSKSTVLGAYIRHAKRRYWTIFAASAYVCATRTTQIAEAKYSVLPWESRWFTE